MNITSQKVAKRTRRHARIRTHIIGTTERPRLAIYRSNRFIYAQLINDEAGNTVIGLDTRKAKGKTLHERAKATGLLLAEMAKSKGVTKIVFDRGGFQYKGTIVSFAEGAREGGLVF